MHAHTHTTPHTQTQTKPHYTLVYHNQFVYGKGNIVRGVFVDLVVWTNYLHKQVWGWLLSQVARLVRFSICVSYQVWSVWTLQASRLVALYTQFTHYLRLSHFSCIQNVDYNYYIISMCKRIVISYQEVQ